MQCHECWMDVFDMLLLMYVQNFFFRADLIHANLGLRFRDAGTSGCRGNLAAKEFLTSILACSSGDQRGLPDTAASSSVN